MVKEGSPGGAKVAKNEFFCNNLAKKQKKFLIDTYNNQTPSVSMRTCPPQYT